MIGLKSGSRRVLTRRIIKSVQKSSKVSLGRLESLFDVVELEENAAEKGAAARQDGREGAKLIVSTDSPHVEPA